MSVHSRRAVARHQGGARDRRGRAPAPRSDGDAQVKEVRVGGHGKGSRRHVVCHNPEQAAKDAATRAEMLASLEEKLRSGAKNLIANKGYRRYLKAAKGALSVDREKALEEERFDGMWVLRTNTALPAVEVALKYKQLRMIEQIFRTVKSLLDTRPVFHKTDATICGHVFCSFLALVLRDALLRRMERAKVTAEWADILRDLNALTETVFAHDGKRFAVRSRWRCRQDYPMRRGQDAERRALARGGKCRDSSLKLIGIPARRHPALPPCSDKDSFAPRKPLKQNRCENQTVEDG